MLVEKKMRVLIDTNVFIDREDYKVIPDSLSELLKTLQDSKIKILVHPLSKEELKKDENKKRREIALSKIEAYPVLGSPPTPGTKFTGIVGEPSDYNEEVDNQILYAVYKDAVDFLITNDMEIHTKANELDISQRVFNVEEANDYFRSLLKEKEVSSPPTLKKVPVNNLDYEDPILDDLKEDYSPGFKQWWKKISREGREAWVYYKDNGDLGALLIYNIEKEGKPDFTPSLPKKERLKICTLTAVETGYKIGELFLKMSINYARKNGIDEVFLTHYVRDNDRLVSLIKEFGFSKEAIKGENEAVFIKSLTVDEDSLPESPLQIAKKYYPSYYDGRDVNKYLIPIIPEYHTRLFPDFKGGRQTNLMEFEELITEGNTIKKAYLSHSNIKKIEPGDLVLFYRSRKGEGITTLGVVEKAIPRLTSKEEIIKEVGKRSVYSNKEIEEMAEKETLVILFRQHFHLSLLPLDTLRGIGLSHPQSIGEIQHEKYLEIKERGEIDERFTVDKA